MDACGWTALHYAVYNQSLTATQLLLSHAQKCEFNQQAVSENLGIPATATALHIAVILGEWTVLIHFCEIYSMVIIQQFDMANIIIE